MNTIVNRIVLSVKFTGLNEEVDRATGQDQFDLCQVQEEHGASNEILSCRGIWCAF